MRFRIENLYQKARLPARVARWALGLGESYMDGWWDCHALDQFFDRSHLTEAARAHELLNRGG